MRFTDAVQLCFGKYADFNGRAQRPEFWWYVLFIFLGGLATRIFGESAAALFSVATLLPSLAVGARRLHDTGRSGWWLLLWIVPLVGWIIMIIFMAQQGQATDNQYGSPPAS